MAHLRLLDKNNHQNSESSSDSAEEEMKINEDTTSLSTNIGDKVQLTDISDIFELCKNNCSYKFLSVLLYMSLRHFNITWRDCDLFSQEIGSLSSQTCQKWVDIFVSGDIDQFCADNRGGKHIETFYETFPELELSAKVFAVERCSSKSADFTVQDLASFIDEKPSPLGFRFDSNSKRPYFEGHERPDIVSHREEFIKYFLEKKDHYYMISNDESPIWKMPTQSPASVLIFHDETTFRSGEVSAKRWVFENNAPFFSKGRGRSVMISDYLIMHPSGPFFTLDEKEYKQALETFPELAKYDDDVNYIEKTATGSIDVGYNSYFDNSTILSQFERLFKLLRFKNDFKNHTIEVVVDNATTHAAKAYSLLDFGKSIGTKCTTDTVEYIDSQSQQHVVDCFFQNRT
ncbi:unnamed protein product [Adineta ricciae]|uniref:Uncharacterized protein n=1 Tax=Adineta ricciae TaxID=249248 RepID=A0A815YYR1_ADIRI|nr:unnamed protein product [Adineta ricciae]CAF1577608.1 unnamed protein product [Adineta ricciae]